MVPAYATPSDEVVCSYAPSQSNLVAAVSGAAGGASITTGVVASALGFTIVPHSSGAFILTGSSGYIAGTIGVAAVAPAIVVVSLFVGGAVVTLELVCAKKNHRAQVAKVEVAATEFYTRFASAMKNTPVVAHGAKAVIVTTANRGAVEIKRIAGDVWKYANRASIDARNRFSR